MSDPNQSYGAVPPPPPPPPGPPGPPPPPGPGMPGGPEGPEGGKGKGLWIALAVIGALALIGVVITVVLLVAGGDDDEPTDPATTGATSETTDADEPTDSPDPSLSPGDPTTPPGPGGTSTADAVDNDPEAVTQAFLDSVLAGDCATAEDLVTADYLEKEGDCNDEEIPSDLADQVTFEVQTAQVDESAGTATVPVQVSAGGESETGEFYLKKVDGQWLVDGTSDDTQ